MKIGDYLRQIRKARCLTLERVGSKAGLSRVTVNRWETGVSQPRLAELEAVLKVLEVTPEQREQALALVEAPRAVLRLRESAEKSKADLVERAGHAPAIGDLLRAMRQRRRLTVEETAESLGVSSRSVRRWENSEASFPEERLDDLCGILGVAPEERITLSTKRLWLWTPDEPGAQTLESLEHRFESLFARRYVLMQSRMIELHLLTLEAQVWTLASRNVAARNLLAQIYTEHAHFLSDQERFEEMGTFANRALEITPENSYREGFWIAAGIYSAHASSLRGAKLIPRQSLERFHRLLSSVQHPHQEGWILSWIGELLVEEGAIESGLAFMDRACEVVARCDDPIHRRVRESDKASMLLKIGQPANALAILNPEAGDNPYFHTGLILERVEAYLGVGEVSEAHDHLQEAYSNIEVHHLSHFGLHADALARRF